MTDVESFLKRFEAAKTRKQNWDVLYNECLDYAAPHRQIYYDNPATEGKKKDNADRVFDSTAMVALDSFVANLQSSLVPPNRRWIEFEAGHGIPEDQREKANTDLEGITRTLFDYLAISNFDTQIASSFADYATGVGALMVCKGTLENPLHFYAQHVAETYLEEGPHGRVSGVFRCSRVQARNLEATWPDVILDGALKRRVAEKPDEFVEVVEGMLPDTVEAYDLKTTARRSLEGYVYCVVATREKQILVKREEKSSPWIVYRWPNLPGELYSRGPLVKALPDIKTINKAKELILKAASRDLYGIWMYLDDGVVNLENIEFGPMTFIPVEYTGGVRGEAIKPLGFNGTPNVAQFVFNDLQQSIYKTLFAEPLGRVDLPVKSATEVAIRAQEMSRRMGSAFGKLQFELMVPLVNRCLYILEEFGLVDLGGFKIDGRIINIKYRSPLAQAQDEDDLGALQRYGEYLVALFGPQYAMALMKPDRVAPYLAGKLNVPQALVPTKEEFSMMEQALMENAKMQVEQQQPLDPQTLVEGVA